MPLSMLCRLSTAGLLTILCMLYQRWYISFLGLLMLDVASHWVQMQATLVSGAASHKVCFALYPASHTPGPNSCLYGSPIAVRLYGEHVISRITAICCAGS